MKKVIAILLITVMAFGAAACQKTPESPIVVGNNTEKMIEQAQKENSDTVTESCEPINLYVHLNAPKTYSQELVSKEGKLRVFADAQVLLPSCELPIVRVRPTEFTLEQVQCFAEVHIGDDAAYVRYDYDNQTRGACERRIERLRYGLSDWTGIGQYIFDLQYNTVQEAEAALSELVTKAAAAPEAYPVYTPDFEWEYRKSWINGKEVENNDTYLTLFSTKDQATFSYLEIRNARQSSGLAEMVYIRDYELPLDTYFDDIYTGSEALHLSAEAARQQAEQTIAQMGIAGFACTSNVLTSYRTEYDEKKPAYHITFTRQIGAVTETYTNAEAALDDYNQPWYYEVIHVLIDEGGILRFEYKSPYEIVETVVANTKLLSFDKIQDIFEKMSLIVDNEIDYNPVWDSSGGMEYHITTVRLGLVCVREKNTDTGLLVPAWDFLGYERGRMSSDTNWRTVNTNELEPYLTINAIDGNIIERGY